MTSAQGGLAGGEDTGETHSLGRNSPGKHGGQVTRLRRQLCRVWQIQDWEARVEWEEARDAGEKAGKAC